MRVLLISLQTNSYLVGIKYIASNVIANGHDARILFMPGYMEERLSPAIEGFISDYAPDLIGIGLMSIEFYPSRNMTELLRESFDIRAQKNVSNMPIMSVLVKVNGLLFNCLNI
jgi:hypothetical protein